MAIDLRLRDGAIAKQNIHFTGRLHYRAELARALGEASSLDDTQLIERAYRRWGGESFARLEGDFALVLIDRTVGRIFALRDAMGGVPLFWRHDRGELRIASDLGAIASPTRKVPAGYIADVLLMASPNPDDLDTCPDGGLARVRPGHLIEFDLGGKVRATRDIAGWSLRIAAQKETSAAAFREVLTRAVRERLTGRMAAHVSGGMDSTSVAIIAAGLGAPVHGLSLVYERIAELKGESAYLDQVRHEGLTIIRLPADDLLDFDAFANITAHDEPSPWLFRAGQDLAMLQTIRAAGCTTILTGIGADETLAVVPWEIADHLRRGRLRQAHAVAAKWAGAHRTGAWRLLLTFGIEPLLAPHSAWFDMRQRRWQPPPWLSSDFVRTVEWPDRACQHARRFHGEGKSCLEAQLGANIRNSAGDWINNSLAKPMGLALAHPFRDPRVLALGAAARLATEPEPRHPKPLLAEAMRGLVPDVILDRRGKARFDAIHYKGLARHRAMLADMVTGAPKDIEAFFDRGALKAAIEDAARGYRHLDQLHGLAASLAVVKWLTLRP